MSAKRQIFCFLIFLISCKTNMDSNKNTSLLPNSSNFAFLEGNWKRINTQEGETTREVWYPDGEMWKGHAYTLKNNDTTFQERTKILVSETTWVYRVMISGDSIATDFQMIAITDSSFLCQNLNNEYPKNIFYSKRKDQLYAKISGGGPEIEYFFEKN